MFKKRREDSSSSIKRRIRRFHVVVVQWTSEKCNYKTMITRAKPLFCSICRCCDCLSSQILKTEHLLFDNKSSPNRFLLSGFKQR